MKNRKILVRNSATQFVSTSMGIRFMKISWKDSPWNTKSEREQSAFGRGDYTIILCFLLSRGFSNFKQTIEIGLKFILLTNFNCYSKMPEQAIYYKGCQMATIKHRIPLTIYSWRDLEIPPPQFLTENFSNKFKSREN